jgi:2-polyprenyl-6-methoxyphenol hydroxylase-like FAD-dependent oxidoreductase
MFRNTPVTALIVGAGPVGLFTALTLAQRGESVRIIDRGVRTNHESYAVALHSSSLTLLEGAGVLDEVIAEGLKLDRVQVEGFDGPSGALLMSRAKCRFPYLLVMSQGRLEKILSRALERMGVEVEWRRAFASMNEGTEQVTVTLDHLGEQALGYAVSDTSFLRVGASRLQAQFVIGADGVWSSVRRACGLGFMKTGTPRQFEVFEYEVPSTYGLHARVLRNENGLHMFWPLPHNRQRWTFEVAESRGGELGLGELAEHFERNMIATNPPEFLIWSSTVSFTPGHVERAGAGRCWLIGDAAHRMLPHGVQSINVGFTDGALLASRIADARIAGIGYIDFAEYARGRMEEWQYLLGVDLAPQDKELRAIIPAAGRAHRVLSEEWASGPPAKVPASGPA